MTAITPLTIGFLAAANFFLMLGMFVVTWAIQKNKTPKITDNPHTETTSPTPPTPSIEIVKEVGDAITKAIAESLRPYTTSSFSAGANSSMSMPDWANIYSHEPDEDPYIPLHERDEQMESPTVWEESDSGMQGSDPLDPNPLTSDASDPSSSSSAMALGNPEAWEMEGVPFIPPTLR